MALLFMEGFDAGDTALKWIGGSAAGLNASTRFSSGRAATMSNGSIARDFSASSQIFVGLACSTSNIDGVVRPYVLLCGDAGATVHLSIGITSTSVTLFRGNLATSLATVAGIFTPNTWYSFEVSATIADAGGTCVVKLNGTTIINYTGDTRNAGTNTTFDRIYLGSNGGYVASFDDVYVCDGTGSAPYNTFLGDVRVMTLSPNGAGSSTGFTPSTGANYTTVDELPYSATDYVTATASGTRDLYALSDVSGSYSVLAVQNNVIAKKADAGGAALKPAIKTGGTVYYGSNVTLGSSDAIISDLRTTNPSTATAWTVADVNGLEAGMEIV